MAGEPSVGDIVFYQNATSGEEGGKGSTIVMDAGAQGFPMSLLFWEAEAGGGQADGQGEEGGQGDAGDAGDGGEGVSPIDVTVSGSTPGLSVREEEENAPRVAYSGGGTFWICDLYVEYYRAVYPVFAWSEGDVAADGCRGVDVVPVCAKLEDLPDGALGTHEFVEEVGCFVDGGAAGEGRA